VVLAADGGSLSNGLNPAVPGTSEGPAGAAPGGAAQVADTPASQEVVPGSDGSGNGTTPGASPELAGGTPPVDCNRDGFLGEEARQEDRSFMATIVVDSSGDSGTASATGTVPPPCTPPADDRDMTTDRCEAKDSQAASFAEAPLPSQGWEEVDPSTAPGPSQAAGAETVEASAVGDRAKIVGLLVSLGDDDWGSPRPREAVASNSGARSAGGATTSRREPTPAAAGVTAASSSWEAQPQPPSERPEVGAARRRRRSMALSPTAVAKRLRRRSRSRMPSGRRPGGTLAHALLGVKAEQGAVAARPSSPERSRSARADTADHTMPTHHLGELEPSKLEYRAALVDVTKAILSIIFESVKPKRLDDISDLMEKYKGSEISLLSKLLRNHAISPLEDRCRAATRFGAPARGVVLDELLDELFKRLDMPRNCRGVPAPPGQRGFEVGAETFFQELNILLQLCSVRAAEERQQQLRSRQQLRAASSHEGVAELGSLRAAEARQQLRAASGFSSATQRVEQQTRAASSHEDVMRVAPAPPMRGGAVQEHMTERSAAKVRKVAGPSFEEICAWLEKFEGG